MNLNLEIRRKHFNNFIKEGNKNMNYRISNEMSKKAKSIIEGDELKERLVVLNDQLNFLGDSSECKKVANEHEISVAKSELEKILEITSSLNFKKEQLQVQLNKYLLDFDIINSAKIKTQLSDIDMNIQNLKCQESQYRDIINGDKLEYENQMLKIKEKYDNEDIIHNPIDNSDFSDSVISDYKKSRASKLLHQFLDSLTEEKQNEILESNENLKGYLNVGENI